MRAGSWGSICVMYVYIVLAGAAIGKVVPVVPDMAHAMGCSIATAAWFISVIVAASVLLAPLGGELTDRFGDRKMILVGVLASMAGCGGDIIAGNFYALLVARTAEGLGYVCLSLGTAAMMTRTVQGPRLPVAMALVSAAVPFGSGAAMALSGFAAGAHWHNVFWVSGAAWGVSLLGLPLLPAWTKTKSAGHVNASWVAVAAKSAPARLALGMCVATIILFGLGTLFPLFLETAHGLSPVRANAVGIIGFPAPIAGSLLMGAILVRYQNIRNLIWLCLAVMAIAGPFVFFPGLSIRASLIIFIVFYLFGGMLSSIGMARLPSVVPNPAAMGVTTSLFIQGANLGVLLGAPLMYFSYTRHGGAGITGLLLVCIVSTLWSWGFQPTIAAKHI